MTKRADKTSTDIRQEQIAHAALALIGRHGVAGLSVAGVAKEVGVVPSGIYRHYRSKDDILDVVIDLIAQRLQANVQAVRMELADPLERLHQLLLRHLGLIRGNSGILRIVLSEEIFSGQPKRRLKVYRMMGHYLKEVAILVRETHASGGTASTVTPDAAAIMFLGLIQPAAILWMMSDGEFDLEQHAEDSWQLFRWLIRPSDSAETAAPADRPPTKSTRGRPAKPGGRP